MKKILSMILAVVIITASFVDFPKVSAEDEAEKYLASMSTEEKISQMIMPVFRTTPDENGEKVNVTEITEYIEESLSKHPYAGVLLMGQNTPTNENTVRLINDLQLANAKGGSRPRLLISIDQEGGNVARLDQGTMMPGNMALGAIGDVNVTKEVAGIIGAELYAAGVNVDFAPVVDVNCNPANPVIGVRSFSDDAETVAAHGSVFTEALNETGIISTLKHFPGHGDTDTDSHSGLPSIDKSYEELKKTELVPFAACIEAGSQMIMTAHIVYPQIETKTYKSKKTGENINLPATLSETIITGILREDMGFDGVVITDAMEMDAINLHFDKYDAAVLAIEAGVDILLAPVETVTKQGFDEMDEYISTLAAKADNGEISMQKIDAAVLRILKLKQNNGLFLPYDASDIESRVDYALNNIGTKANHDKEWEYAKKAITLVKNDDNTLPLVDSGEKTVVLVPYDDEVIPMQYAVKKLQAEGKLPENAVVESYSYRKKALEEVQPMTEGADNIIFLSEIYSASALKNDVAAMADALADGIHEKGGKFIVMSVNLPYDAARFEKADAIILAYLAKTMSVDPEDKVKEIKQYGANMPAALYVMFDSEATITARLPVNIMKLDENYDYSDEVLYARGFGLSYEKDEPEVPTEEAEDETAKGDDADISPAAGENSAADVSPETGKNSTIDVSPATGENSPAVVWTILALCAAGMAVSLKENKRKS